MFFTQHTTKYKHGNSGSPSGDSGCVGQCFVRWPSPAIPITVSVWGQQISTLTTANSCTSQPAKERGVLPNETRKQDAVKIPYVISHLFPTVVAAVVINSLSMAKSSVFEPYQCSSFDILKKNVKRRKFLNISRKICYGFLCCCHLFLLPCEPQHLRLVADYKTKDRGSVPVRGRHFFLSLNAVSRPFLRLTQCLTQRLQN